MQKEMGHGQIRLQMYCHHGHQGFDKKKKKYEGDGEETLIYADKNDRNWWRVQQYLWYLFKSLEQNDLKEDNKK